MVFNILTISFLILGLCIISFNIIFNAILAHSLAKETRLLEARRMKEEPKSKRSTCIIIGAGVAGCLTAAIASRHFEKVILIDPIPTIGNPNTYIAQIDQIHFFLPLSYEGFKSAWPNGIFEKVFKSFGGKTNNSIKYPHQLLTFAGQIIWTDKIPGISNPKEFPLAATIGRRALHKVLRCLIEKYTPNTRLIIGKAVQARFSQSDKISAKEGASVESIKLQHRDSGESEWIDCELLIDCSASQRVFRKLIADDSRFSEPKSEKYTMNVTYNTAIFDIHPSLIDQIPIPNILKAIPENLRKDQLAFLNVISSVFTDTHSSFILGRQESNKFALCCIEYLDEARNSPIKSIEEFQELYKSCYYTMFNKDVEPWFVDLMDFLRENEDLMEQKIKFQKYTDLESYSYNFGNLSKDQETLPNNLILLGDSYAKLNPAFGQGAQKASGEAMTLHSALLDNQPKLDENEKGSYIESSCVEVVKSFNNSRQYYVKKMFTLNRALDLGKISIQSANPQLSPNMGKFQRKVFKEFMNCMAKSKDKEIGTLFWGSMIIGSIAPVTLMHPFYLIKVLYAKFFL